MAEYEENFRNHPVHNELDRLADLIDKWGDESDEKAVSVLARIRRAVAHTKSRIEIADIALTPLSALNTIGSHASNVKGQLTTFQSNRNVAHLDKAHNQLDGILGANSLLVVPLGDDAEANLLAVAERLREEGEEAVRDAAERLGEITERLDKFTDSITITESKLSELTGEIQNQKERVDSVVSDFQKTSQEREDARTNQFNEALKGYNQQISTVQRDFESRGSNIEATLREKTETHEKAFTEEGSRILGDLEKSRKQASDLVHVVGNIGVTGNYQQTADEDKTAADRFRVGAVACFLLMAGIIVWTAFDIDTIGWQSVLYRLGAALIFVFPGAYMALESSKHREAANRNRRIELELASLGPFIETLSDDQKAALRQKLTERYFGQPHEVRDHADSLPTSGLVEVLKVVQKFTDGK